MEGEVAYRFFLESDTILKNRELVEKQFYNDHLGKHGEFHEPKSELHRSICF